MTSWKLFLQGDLPETDHRALDKVLKEWQTVLDKYRQCVKLENTKQLTQEDAAIGNFCGSLLKKEHTFMVRFGPNSELCLLLGRTDAISQERT